MTGAYTIGCWGIWDMCLSTPTCFLKQYLTVTHIMLFAPHSAIWYILFPFQFLPFCLSVSFFHRHYAISELCSFEALYAFNFVFSQEESYNLIYKKTIQWKKFLPKNVTHCTQGTYNYINLYRPVFHYSNIVLVHMYNACITFSFPLPLKNICSWFDNHDSCSKCIVWFLVYPVFSSNSYLICLTTLRWSVKVFPCWPVF